MRLLNTYTGVLEPFTDARKVSYAILSHVWAQKGDENQEQIFGELPLIPPSGAEPLKFPWLSSKIQNACSIARRHNFRYIWIDTCCIDKSSSAELSEAINSMYHWYCCANVCYAFLHDVDSPEEPSHMDQFEQSKWFRRGWTLQELVAPRDVVFLSKEWSIIGSKYDLADVVHNITTIDIAVLRNEKQLTDVSVAARMSWASERETTYEEDQAYCLLGIFNVHIPAIYGEGRYAFIRLQEAILKQIPDQSILAWGPPNMAELSLDQSPAANFSSAPVKDIWNESTLLASSPKDFVQSRNMEPISLWTLAYELRLAGSDLPYPNFTFTAYGVSATLPLITCYDQTGGDPFKVAILACKHRRNRLVGLVLRDLQESSSQDSDMLVRAPFLANEEFNLKNPYNLGMRTSSGYFRLTAFASEDLRSRSQEIETTAIYIRHHLQPSQYRGLNDINLYRMLCETPLSDRELNFELVPWCAELLSQQGYYIMDKLPLRFSLHHEEHDVMTVQFGLCTCSSGINMGWLRLQITSSRDLCSLQDNESPISAGDIASDCPYHETHVYEWSMENGVANKTFDTTNRRIRVTLGLRPDPFSASLSPGSYVIDLKISSISLSEALLPQALLAPIGLHAAMILYGSLAAAP